MQLMRRKDTWDPFRDFDALSNRMAQLWDMKNWGLNGEQESLIKADWFPSCDVSETDKEYRVTAELPKVKKDDIHVNIDNGVLTIQGERREEKEEKDVKFHRREMVYGNFMRQFALPDNVDSSKVDASFKDGVLNVKINKVKEKETKMKQVVIN